MPHAAYAVKGTYNASPSNIHFCTINSSCRMSALSSCAVGQCYLKRLCRSFAQLSQLRREQKVGQEVTTKRNAHMKWAFATKLYGLDVGCAGKI